MIPIEFHAKVARDVTNDSGDRAIAVETIERATHDVLYAEASRTERKEFWSALKAEIAAVRRSIPQRRLPEPLNIILNAALEESFGKRRSLGILTNRVGERQCFGAIFGRTPVFTGATRGERLIDLRLAA